MSQAGGFILVPPGGGAQHWQPQPANGWIEVLTSPRMAGMPAGFSAGFWRAIWAMGPAGTNIRLQVSRGKARRDVTINSADRVQFLKRPRLH